MLRGSTSRGLQSWHYATSAWHQTLGRRLASSQGGARGTNASSGVPYEQTLKNTGSEGEATLPSSADVVVIGGGAVGCSTLYHLSKLGMNAVLVEKDQLTAGTTWHTAGLLWQFRTSDIEIELINYSRHLLKTLEDETGVNPGWIENGGLFIASNKVRLDEYKRLATLGSLFNIESHVLSPEETKELYPLMNVSDVYGTLYVPGDGTMEPAGYCTALTRGATRNGAKVFTETAVEAITVNEDDFGVKRVKTVHTSRGSIGCDAVVNATGCWAPKIGEMVGVEVPLVPMKHAYVVTERIEGIQNMPNVRDHDASLYLRLQGDALSLGGYEAHPEILDEVANEFAFSLYDLNYDVFGVHIEGAVNRVPAIENTGIKSTVCGPESFTADHKPILGESPDVRGFYYGCGFNSAGMMMSGGWGRELAHWVKNGRPQVDMYSYDIRRFNSKLLGNKKWRVERSHEAYAKNYSIVFMHDQPLAARNHILGAVHQPLLEAGCVYEERHGWERPGWFSPEGPAPILPYDYYGSYDTPVNENNVYKSRVEKDYTFDFPEHHSLIGEEVHACRENVVVIDMSYFGKFFLTGPDAQKLVNWTFSGDMQKGGGSTVYTCMLNDNGGVEADLTVSTVTSGNGQAHNPEFSGPGFYVAAGGAISTHVRTHIQNVINDKRLKCQIIDNTEKMAVLSIQGPKSRDLLQELTGADLSNDSFPFSTNKVLSIGGAEFLALRISFVGELGWELHVPSETAVQVYRTLMDAGAKYGIKNCGYRAMDSMSVEKGYRHWHADLRSTDTPLEAGLAFTCKLKTPIPFKGREAIEKQKQEGIRKKLICLTTEKPLCLSGFETIFRDGILVGNVRQGDYAFTLGKTVAYGYIKCPDGGKVTMDFVRQGNYEIEFMGKKYAAFVHTKSPFDPENKRVKGFY
ncbi:sarcosine dehydrogenase, mitochondrial-like [Liolophura sinensis]|uniref:sarcosine dehydrogenase, mitochondrial-like n=1 Tax=Liolophura sinensis TaxID=3198878 RepID=UPI0031584B8D